MFLLLLHQKFDFRCQLKYWKNTFFLSKSINIHEYIDTFCLNPRMVYLPSTPITKCASNSCIVFRRLVYLSSIRIFIGILTVLLLVSYLPTIIGRRETPNSKYIVKYSKQVLVVVYNSNRTKYKANSYRR